MFPTLEEVKVVFLLYHMNVIPIIMVHMPISTKSASMSLGDNENGYFSSISSRTLLNMSIDIGGSYNIFALSVSISLVVNEAKFNLYHIRNLLKLVMLV